MAININKYVEDFKYLNPKDPGTWPAIPKLAALILILVGIIAGAYFLDWQVQLDELEAGLRAYVGAAISGQDGGYVVKVLAEQVHLRQVADGKPVSVNAALPAAAKSSLAVETADRIIQPAGAASAVAPTLGVERVALLD